MTASDSTEDRGDKPATSRPSAEHQTSALEDVAALAAAACRADFGAVLLQSGRDLVTVAASGFPEEWWQVPRDPLAALCVEPTPFFRAEIAMPDESIGSPRPGSGLPIRACAAEPIRSPLGDRIGVLLVADRNPRPFHSADRHRLSAGARCAADLIAAGDAGVDPALGPAGRGRALGDRKQLQQLAVAGQIASGIAHDACNLLTAILASAEMIKQLVPPGTSLSVYAANTATAADSAGGLLRRLLNVARPDPSPAVVLDLNSVVEQLLETLAAAVGRSIELRIELAGGGAWIRCRRSDIERVLLNLAMNARQSLDQAGRITVRTLRTEPEDATVAPRQAGAMLEVEDTGRGISPEHHARIFDPYFSTRSAGGGTGLGLALVQSVVEGAGGTIEVDSRPGLGTRFRLRFPPAEPATPA